MVNTFGRNRYGETLAAVGTLEQTISMLAPVMFQSIYRATESIEFDVGPFKVGCITMLVASGLALLGVVVSLFVPEIPRNRDWESDKLSTVSATGSLVNSFVGGA